MQDWGRKEQPWLRTFLSLPHGIPSQDTYLRVPAALDPQQFRRAFASWVSQVLAPLGLAAQVAIDGKTSRGSDRTLRGQSPVHLVSALACDWGLVLGQTRTADKSNEIVAIPKLLAALNLQGSLVTIDAMGCQRDAAAASRAATPLDQVPPPVLDSLLPVPHQTHQRAGILLVQRFSRQAGR